MTKRELLLTTALISGVLQSAPAFAADLYLVGMPAEPTVIPAVSGLNGKVALFGGEFGEEGFGALSAAFAVPFGLRYGFQGDAILGVRDGDFVGGGGGHLFWRDPTIGLLGLYGGYTHREDIDGSVSRIGVEGEYYWGQWTAKAIVGAEFVDAGAGFVEPDDDFFAFSDISYYLNDNLELSVGHRYTADHHSLALGVEYQLEQQVFASGVSLFAEGRLGEDSHRAVWAGVRFYLGDNKSLIRRHREDDPDTPAEDDLFDLGAKLNTASGSVGEGT